MEFELRNSLIGFNSPVQSRQLTIDMPLEVSQLLLDLIDQCLVLLRQFHGPLVTLANATLLVASTSFRHEARLHGSGVHL